MITNTRAMAINPKLLLLDEPLSALDIRTKEKLCILLKKIHTLTSPKKTFVHITHDFQEAISLGDRIAIMNNGKIVQVGEPYEVFRKPKSVFVANFVGVENLFKGIANNSENGFIKININPKLSFYAIAKKTISPGHVYVSIRPEEIFITKKGCISNSTKNLFQGTVTEVLDRGALLHIKIDIGIPINSIVTRMTYKDMGLNIGSELCVSFKENEVHVF
ncbi:MAG: ABC transporter ATP-binding protein [Methanosarcinales archaeon]